MNPDETRQLEDRLRGLTLRMPSPELDARIASLRPATLALRTRRQAAGVAVAAAAVVACLLVTVLWRPSREQAGASHSVDGRPRVTVPRDPPRPQPTPTELPRRPEPLRIEQVWSTVSAGEVVARDGQPPMQRLSRHALRRIQWIDEGRHVRIEWNIPSQQSALVPLEYN